MNIIEYHCVCCSAALRGGGGVEIGTLGFYLIRLRHLWETRRSEGFRLSDPLLQGLFAS